MLGGEGGGPGMFWAFFSLGCPGDTDTDPEDKKTCIYYSVLEK